MIILAAVLKTRPSTEVNGLRMVGLHSMDRSVAGQLQCGQRLRSGDLASDLPADACTDVNRIFGLRWKVASY